MSETRMTSRVNEFGKGETIEIRKNKERYRVEVDCLCFGTRHRFAGLHKCTLCKGSRWGIKATRCENETAEPRSVFWTIGQRRRKESARRNGREKERQKTRLRGKKASARVFRSLNVTRTALPRSSDSRARARAALQSGALCNAPLLLLNRALDRCRRTIKIASPTCQTYLRVSSTDPLSVSVA